jgi:hypothetical protein
LIKRHVQSGIVCVFQHERLRVAVAGDLLQTDISANAMLEVHDIVAGFEFCEINGCPSGQHAFTAVGDASLTQRGGASE